ncbi:MAG: hypothetical protein K9G49_04880 [Taibaiella sp.]|nr:hypothetical protein [Taibaiella sp.]
MILILVPALSLLLFTACSKKVYTGKPAETAAANPADFLPFSKALKFRLEQDRADLKKIQFYVDKPLILRHTAGTGSSTVKSGTVAYDNAQNVTEFTIPAYTPGICERVKGDSLYISFDAPQNSFVFAAIYANEQFMLQGTNWYNGVTDVTYDNKIFKVQCDGCGSAGEAKLVIKRTQAGSAGKTPGGGKVLAGRKLN